MLQDRSITQATGMNGDWSGVLDRYGVRFLVLDTRNDIDLLELFRSQSGWTVDFEDEEAVIFVRADVAQTHNSHDRTHDAVMEMAEKCSWAQAGSHAPQFGGGPKPSRPA